MLKFNRQVRVRPMNSREKRACWKAHPQFNAITQMNNEGSFILLIVTQPSVTHYIFYLVFHNSGQPIPGPNSVFNVSLKFLPFLFNVFFKN
jgi:hypothetical protein